MNLLQLRKLLTNNRFHFSKRQEITNPHDSRIYQTYFVCKSEKIIYENARLLPNGNLGSPW